MLLNKKQLKAILAFAGSDPCRESLMGLAVIRGVIYAIDGHTAVRWDTGCGITSGWIPREVAERAIKIAKARDEIMVTDGSVAVGGIEIGKVDPEIPSPHKAAHNGKIVDWSREPSGCPKPWAVNTAYMARLTALAKAAGARDPHWIVDVTAPRDPILFTLATDHLIQAVIMPVRIPE